MKTKLVLWGQKGSEEAIQNVLVALELNPNTNKVSSWVFEGEVATDEFSKALLDNWRKGEAIAFPEGVEAQETALDASGSLLPEGITTDKDELLNRTQTEWIFMVLSTKLYQSYHVELDELQEKVDALTSYSKATWDALKTFWDKVQSQVNEQNVLREHSNTLRQRSNELFSQLKKMRAKEDDKFEAESAANHEKVVKKLEPIEALIAQENCDFSKTFDLLRNLQNEFKNVKLSKSMRSKLWDRIDVAFKNLKAKRSGNNNTNNNGADDSSAENRLLRRLDGLKDAIHKMEKSIGRDKQELEEQTDRINARDVNQIETQLREVRAKLIRERMESKNNKLEDMYKTLKDLEAKQARSAAKKAKEEKVAVKEVVETVSDEDSEERHSNDEEE